MVQLNLPALSISNYKVTVLYIGLSFENKAFSRYIVRLKQNLICKIHFVTHLSSLVKIALKSMKIYVNYYRNIKINNNVSSAWLNNFESSFLNK